MPTSLRARLVDLYVSDGLRDLRRATRRLARRVRGRPRALTYVHEVDDPYCALMVQILPRFVEAAGAQLQIAILPTPGEAYAPDRARLRAWAQADAARLARRHGLRFPEVAAAPSLASIEDAQRAALIEGPWRGWLARLDALSQALLAGEAIAADAGGPSEDEARARLRANEAEVHRLGHYQGGMLHYEGEWYWGLDRLALLEQRLRDEGLDLAPTLDPGAPVIVEPAPAGAAIELFYSMRSPYSYLALDRSVALARRHGVELQIRLVLPMVMRGLAVPWLKRRSIVLDCKRLAGELGVDFGRIADPVGEGIERCMAVATLARREDRLVPWLRAVGEGVWSRGVDVASDRGLRELATIAGLDADAALAAATAPPDDWRAEADANREALLAMGLWGVPCFRIGELALWGQDRLDVLDAALRRGIE